MSLCFDCTRLVYLRGVGATAAHGPVGLTANGTNTEKEIKSFLLTIDGSVSVKYHLSKINLGLLSTGRSNVLTDNFFLLLTDRKLDTLLHYTNYDSTTITLF